MREQKTSPIPGPGGSIGPGGSELSYYQTMSQVHEYRTWFQKSYLHPFWIIALSLNRRHGSVAVREGGILIDPLGHPSATYSRALAAGMQAHLSRLRAVLCGWGDKRGHASRYLTQSYRGMLLFEDLT